MTKHLDSLGAMALELVENEVALYEALEHGLDRVLSRVQRVAKAEFGVYQPAVGAFQAWPELADSTKADRVAQGYSENEPLHRSGDLEESVEKEREGLDGVVGSKDPVLLYQEFGTERIPPRPVLGPAAFRSKPWIEKLVGAAAVAGIVGGQDLARLGYGFETED
jgi:hypothetical protein